MPPRSTEERIADSLRLLESGGDAWVATASGGSPHLVILSAAWDGDAGELVFCTLPSSPAVQAAEARVGLGRTRDVLMLHGALRLAGRVDENPVDAEVFAAGTDWDPRGGSDDYVLLRFRPVRAMAWREADEIAGRTIMRDGRWLSA